MLTEIFSVSISELITGEKEQPAPAPDDNKYEEPLRQHLADIDKVLKTDVKPKKRNRLTIALACLLIVAIIGFGIYYVDRMHKLEDKMNALKTDVSGIENVIDDQLGSIQQEISSSLKKEYGLISHHSIECKNINTAFRTVTLSISATPRQWSGSNTCYFLIETGDRKIQRRASLENGILSCEATVRLTNDISVSIVIRTDDSFRTERLGEINSLFDEHLLTVDADGSALRTSRSISGEKLTVSGDIIAKVHSNLPSLSSESAVVEICENGTPVDSLEMEKDADGSYSLRLDSHEHDIKAGNIFEYVLMLTDTNGVKYRAVIESISIDADLEIGYGVNARDIEIIFIQ